MVNFDEFIKKWTGKPVDFDGIYPNQCMDLMHQYIYEVLEITDKSVCAAPSAYQVYTQFKWPNHFTKIANTPEGVPEKGDIVLFGQTIGQWGHVCIAIEGNVDKFRSFDSNWPTGSLPKIIEHSYVGVLGWLRPKLEEDFKAKYESLVAEYGKLENKVEELKKELFGINDKYQSDIASKTEMIEMLQKTNSEMALQATETSRTLSDTQNKLKAVSEERSVLEDQLSDSTIKIKALETKITKLEEKLKKKLSTYSKMELLAAFFGRS
jgi:hypothetical protein